MKYLLLSLMPLSLCANDIQHEPKPEVFFWRDHQFLKFSEHCIIHSPECECSNFWYMYRNNYNDWEIIKGPNLHESQFGF